MPQKIQNVSRLAFSVLKSEVQPLSVGFEGQRDNDQADVRSNFIE